MTGKKWKGGETAREKGTENMEQRKTGSLDSVFVTMEGVGEAAHRSQHRSVGDNVSS